MCDETSETSSKAKDILSQLKLSIENNLVKSQEPITLFLFVVHDWLAHITESEHKLIEYDSSLGMELSRYTSGELDSITQWRRKIRLQNISLNLLMYRHLLVRQLLEDEIYQPIDTPLIYQLMDSLYYNSPRFSILDDHTAWDTIAQGKSVVNALRARRLDLRNIVIELANREDLTTYQIDVDHAVLSSFTLLYSLHILETMLDFELAIRPNQKVVTIQSNLTHTLDHLRGVFFHVKN